MNELFIAAAEDLERKRAECKACAAYDVCPVAKRPPDEPVTPQQAAEREFVLIAILSGLI